MNDIYHEAEEELKAQKNKIIIKYSIYVFIIISLIAVITTSYYSWNKSSNQSNQEALANELLAVIEENNGNLNSQDIEKLENIAKQNKESYSAIAAIIVAKKFYTDKNYEKFISESENIATSGNYNILFKDYANFNLATYYLEHDNKKMSVILDRVNIDNSPFKNSFVMLRALLDYKEKKYPDAKEQLNLLLKDPYISPVLADNAKALIYLIDKMDKK